MHFPISSEVSSISICGAFKPLNDSANTPPLLPPSDYFVKKNYFISSRLCFLASGEYLCSSYFLRMEAVNLLPNAVMVFSLGSSSFLGFKKSLKSSSNFEPKIGCILKRRVKVFGLAPRHRVRVRLRINSY
jgi:hypothetical protein